jgi:hypothetical protein
MTKKPPASAGGGFTVENQRLVRTARYSERSEAGIRIFGPVRVQRERARGFGAGAFRCKMFRDRHTH